MARAVAEAQGHIPSWLAVPEDYQARKDRDSFVTRSILSVTSVLAHFRLDDGKGTRLSASAPAKLLLGLGCILLTSLSTNYAFVLLMLAIALVRVMLLPASALRRTAGIAFGAAALSFLVMLPAALLGQSHSALLVASKVLTTVSIALTLALTTPFNEMTGALRAFHVPNLFILTIDLALKNIVSLGAIALEVLTSLKLRSVGRNRDKGASIGGVGGVVFLKSQEAAEATFQSMTCRGFDGSYVVPNERMWRAADIAWAAAFALLCLAFAYLEGGI